MIEERTRADLLDDLEAQGQPRYRAGHGVMYLPPLHGRDGLRLWLRHRARFVHGLLDAGMDKKLARRLMVQMPDELAKIVRRWRAKRDRWIASGCPEPKPWALLEKPQ